MPLKSFLPRHIIGVIEWWDKKMTPHEEKKTTPWPQVRKSFPITILPRHGTGWLVFVPELGEMATEKEILFEWRGQTGKSGSFWGALQIWHYEKSINVGGTLQKVSCAFLPKKKWWHESPGLLLYVVKGFRELKHRIFQSDISPVTQILTIKVQNSPNLQCSFSVTASFLHVISEVISSGNNQ